MAQQTNYRRTTDGLSPGQHLLLWSSVVALSWLAVWVVRHQPYSPVQGLGYALGIIGASLMVILFGYPLRKRWRLLGSAWPLRHWFRVHMVCGVLGPVIILFHSRFVVESVNALVAVTCMLLVAISGVVGRFFYRGIHYGLYGRRATAQDTRESLQKSLADVGPKIRGIDELEALLSGFMAWVEQPPSSALGRLWHFASMTYRRRRTVRKARRLVRSIRARADSPGLSPGQLQKLLVAFERTCAAEQRVAQFQTYERLFALWHVIHVPFVYLFVLTAVVHVVAVHVY